MYKKKLLFITPQSLQVQCFSAQIIFNLKKFVWDCCKVHAKSNAKKYIHTHFFTVAVKTVKQNDETIKKHKYIFKIKEQFQLHKKLQIIN